MPSWQELQSKAHSAFITQGGEALSAFEDGGLLGKTARDWLSSTAPSKARAGPHGHKDKAEGEDEGEESDQEDEDAESSGEDGSAGKKKSRKALGWWDADTKLSKANRDFTLFLEKHAVALETSCEAAQAALANCKDSQRFSRETAVVKYRLSWLLTIIQKPQAEMEAMIQAASDGPEESSKISSTASAQFTWGGPCPQFMALKTVQRMRQQQAQLRCCTSASDVKQTFDELRAMKKNHSILMSSIKASVNNLIGAQKVAASCAAAVQRQKEAHEKKSEKTGKEQQQAMALAARPGPYATPQSSEPSILNFEPQGGRPDVGSMSGTPGKEGAVAPYRVQSLRPSYTGAFSSGGLGKGFQAFLALWDRSSLKASPGRVQQAVPENLAQEASSALAKMLPGCMQSATQLAGSAADGPS